MSIMEKSDFFKNLKVVDLIFEVVDARCPYTSRSTQVQTLIRGKESILILNKVDLADPLVTRKWVEFFTARGEEALPVSTFSREGYGAVKKILSLKAADLNKVLKEKGRRNRDLRVAVLGIPNTGKSSFLNSLLGKRAVKSGDRPGVTRGPQWVHLRGRISVLDTPGLMFPQLEDEDAVFRLVFTRAIDPDQQDIIHLSEKLLQFLNERYPSALTNLGLSKGQPLTLESVAKVKNFLSSQGGYDLQRAAVFIFAAGRKGKLGPISLETPDDLQ